MPSQRVTSLFLHLELVYCGHLFADLKEVGLQTLRWAFIALLRCPMQVSEFKLLDVVLFVLQDMPERGHKVCVDVYVVLVLVSVLTYRTMRAFLPLILFVIILVVVVLVFTWAFALVYEFIRIVIVSVFIFVVVVAIVCVFYGC